MHVRFTTFLPCLLAICVSPFENHFTGSFPDGAAWLLVFWVLYRLRHLLSVICSWRSFSVNWFCCFTKACLALWGPMVGFTPSAIGILVGKPCLCLYLEMVSLFPFLRVSGAILRSLTHLQMICFVQADGQGSSFILIYAWLSSSPSTTLKKLPAFLGSANATSLSITDCTVILFYSAFSIIAI